uniref:Uncharacterized protein n=1 Tax=Triticum urartu TaxID=4572 RepID=A0A8R7PZ66_TRIUA
MLSLLDLLLLSSILGYSKISYRKHKRGELKLPISP